MLKDQLLKASLALVGTSFALSGCDQLSGGNVASQVTSTTTATSQPTKVDAYFIDSPVENLAYSSKSYSGYTNSQGGLQCQQQEEVAFSIGSLSLGTAICQRIITPQTLAAKKVTTTEPVTTTSPSGVVTQTGTKQVVTMQPVSSSDPSVVNRVRLLLSLDKDNDASNGIQLPDATAQAAISQKTLDFTDEANFTNVASDVVNRLVGRSLVDSATASAHFAQTLQSLRQVTDSQNSSYQIGQYYQATTGGYNEDQFEKDHGLQKTESKENYENEHEGSENEYEDD